MWDVFISHASEDKVTVVIPLVGQLERQGMTVWVDYRELVLGDSLRQRIDEGLVKSRFGVVILSESFFAKDWPQRELDGMFALDNDVRNRLLPIWHEISSEIIKHHSPMLAGRLAVRTSVGVQRVAQEVVTAIRRRDAPTSEDELLEQLIAEYDQVVDLNDGVRLARKMSIRDSMMALAPRVRKVTRYFHRPTEGGRLAYVALLRQTPRRAELSRLIEICRKTRHRFVWVEACIAIVKHAKVCQMTTRARAQAKAEVDALRYRPLFKRSAVAREAAEQALESLLEHPSTEADE